MMRMDAAKMQPTTTSAAPTQNSTQTGPMGRAIPPMMKPMMMSVTATQETGRPWYSSCSVRLAGLRVETARSGVPDHRP